MIRHPNATWSLFGFRRASRRTVAGLLTLLSILGVAWGTALVTFSALSLVGAPGVAQANPANTSKQYWQKRYQNLQTLVTSLTSELQQARANYSRRRHDQRLRGDTRTELLEQIENLEKRLAKAERDLEEFPDRARRAGALPGWFRDL